MIEARRGLTIIEILVVIAIVALLFTMLLPAVLASRERAREMVCKNILHQINLAMKAAGTAVRALTTGFSPEDATAACIF